VVWLLKMKVQASTSSPSRQYCAKYTINCYTDRRTSRVILGRAQHEHSHCMQTDASSSGVLLPPCHLLHLGHPRWHTYTCCFVTAAACCRLRCLLRLLLLARTSHTVLLAPCHLLHLRQSFRHARGSTSGLGRRRRRRRSCRCWSSWSSRSCSWSRSRRVQNTEELTHGIKFRRRDLPVTILIELLK
jgi:hypothetical protein